MSNQELPTFWYEEPGKAKRPGETTDQWIVRVFGPIPDTEHDQSKDFRCLNLPARGSKEDRESLGDNVYSEQPIRRMQ